MNPELHMDGLQVADIISKMKCDIMICGVERQGQVVIPNGDFVLKNNDMVSMMQCRRRRQSSSAKWGFRPIRQKVH